MMQSKIKQQMTQEERVTAEASERCVALAWNACVLQSRRRA